MTGAFTLRSNHFPIARVKRLGVAGGGKVGEALPENAIRRAGSDSRIDIARQSGAMADKLSLETIGLLLFLITLFVIGAGAFSGRHQLAADLLHDGAGYEVHYREGRTARSGCAVEPCIAPYNFLM